MRKNLSWSALLCVFCFSAVMAIAQDGTPKTAETPATAAAPPAYESNPAFQKAMADGKLEQMRKEYVFAGDAYKKANKIAGGQCAACLSALYQVQMGNADAKQAIATTVAMEAIATTPKDKSMADYLQAYALWKAAGDKPKPAQLDAALAALDKALANIPDSGGALFLKGQVLAKMGRMEDAKAAFTQCVSCAKPGDPARLRAEHFAANPELSLHKTAPAFTVKALDGSKFTLDAMNGRVVLIDFWATWCGPCNEELPHMKKIAKEFKDQPLVILSISWDSDEKKWKDFIAKNEMTWPQYRDADHSLTDQFGINAIPHYFTIDADGVLTSEMLGSGEDVEGKLKKLLAKAREQQKAVPHQDVAGQ